MKVLYFDPIIGASGDMILASLIDCGVPVKYLKEQLSFISAGELKVSHIQKQGVRACRVKFKINKAINEKQFIPLIKNSSLADSIKDQAIKIIERIFAVEKKVHGLKKLHLHELADADTLLDITGSLIAVDYLKIDKLYSRPLKAGTGFIKTVEGRMPAFNFATARLLKGFPVDFLPIPYELTTPTAAAIISTIARPAKEIFFDKITALGYGAGTKTLKNYPNLMRIFIGETENAIPQECTIIETNIDDMNPQDFDLLFENLYKAGALEVFITPVIMKSSRPGMLLTVLTEKNINEIIALIFKQTTTIGIRRHNIQRIKLSRKIKKINSPYGPIRIKIACFQNQFKYSIEYRDLKKIALQTGQSIQKLRTSLSTLLTKYDKKRSSKK